MKIAFLDTIPIRRGAQVFISELSEVLEKQGIQTVRHYLYQAESNAAKVNLRAQDKVFEFSAVHIFEKVPTIQPKLLKSVAQALMAFQPDIILLNGSRTLKYGAALKRFFPIKAKLISRIIDNAEFWNSGKFTHWYYKKLVIPQLDATIGVSQASLESMIRHYNFKKPSTVIHRVFDSKKFENALDREEARKLLGIEEKDEVLLFLGNLTSQKRPDRFIEIVDHLSNSRPNLKALIVGDGPLRGGLESQIVVPKQEPRSKNQKATVKKLEMENDSIDSKVLPLASSVFFTGYQQDVSPYLAAADLLILTSDTEGLPGVVLEAAYFEVPTVSTEVGGIKECLIDDETGILIQDRSVLQFCEKINFLLDHPETRKRMGKMAKTFIAQNFRMDQVANQYLDFFRSLLLPS